MEKANINPAILTWARNRAALSLGELSKGVKQKVEVLESWESGESKPTFNQAQNLAKKLLIPFGYFYLSNPPELAPKIPDLRTVRNEQRNKFSFEFADTLNDALLKQNWFREHLQKEGAEKLDFIGSYTKNHSVDRVAQDIRQTLGLGEEFQRSLSFTKDLFSRLIEKVEEAGILVLRNGVVRNNNKRPFDVDEFRGFVLSDPWAPLIFLNNKDAQSAQLFTLAHELAHLWLGESGVTNIQPEKVGNAKTIETERFCNQVAAEVLLPKSNFIEAWDIGPEDYQEKLNFLRKRFHVSAQVILIRARTLVKVSSKQFQEWYSKLSRQSSQKKSSGGDFRNTAPVRNSKRFTREILRSAFAGETLYLDAAQLLNVKIDTLDSLAKHLEIR